MQKLPQIPVLPHLPCLHPILFLLPTSMASSRRTSATRQLPCLRQPRHLTLAPVRASMSACGRPIIGPPPEWTNVFTSRSSHPAETETLAALANRNNSRIHDRSSRTTALPHPFRSISGLVNPRRCIDKFTPVLDLSRSAAPRSRLPNPASPIPSERSSPPVPVPVPVPVQRAKLAPRSRPRSRSSPRFM